MPPILQQYWVEMPDLLRCTNCGLNILGFAFPGEEPKPIGRDECYNCGGTEFELPTGDE